MSNVINNNFHNLKLRVNGDEYWDFFINKDSYGDYEFDSSKMYDKCLISYIDSALDECVDGDWLLSTSGYSWESANTTTYELSNIGYTGVDNGLIKYLRDRINNRTFFDIYTKSKYNIEEGDKRLKLHTVSGTNRIFDYDVEYLDKVIKLDGGFFQGFFETQCDKYAILPSVLQNGETWEFEFVLNKHDFEETSKKKLNDKYPNNKGIFFYIGTRAENKWIYLYDTSGDTNVVLDASDYICGVEENIRTYKMNNLLDANPDLDEEEEEESHECGCEKKKESTIEEHVEYKIVCCSCGNCRKKKITRYTSNEEVVDCNVSKCDIFGENYLEEYEGNYDDAFDLFDEDLDISYFEYETNEDKLRLDESGLYVIETDNKFLTFDRTCDGFNVHNYISGSLMHYIGRKNKFTGNLFLLLNRTCTGYTVNNIREYIESSTTNSYNIYNDIYDNALAFRITDDGAVGYRYYTVDCDSETQTTVREGYSKDGLIKDDEWVTINVKISGYYKTMVLRFYVNGYLVFVTDEMRKINLRKLDEVYEKQEGVPYNISIGGGTQGLSSVVLPNYMLDPYRVYPLEENFAGSFIGYFKSFKFFNCPMEYMSIFSSHKYEYNSIKTIWK